MGLRFATAKDRDTITRRIVGAAKHASLQLTPPELASGSPPFQQADGTSVFRPKASTVHSSEQTLAAEDRLLAAAANRTAPTVPLAWIEQTARTENKDGYTLSPDQEQANAKIGISGRTLDVLADPSTTRENLYVAMTRGRHANLVYVATDRPDDSHTTPHLADDPNATARSVLYGALQHVGAELSAHETIIAEQGALGSVAQLAAEHETIAQAAQHDRFATVIRQSGLTPDEAEDTIHSEAFGALSSEMRRAEANHHNIDTLIPRLVAARGFGDADDIASVLHHRLTRATARPAGSGRTRKSPQLIVGLIPEAAGEMSAEMQTALTERRDLIEQRADAILDHAVSEKQDWALGFGEPPTAPRAAAMWHRQARTVAAYRDRYGITAKTPLGPAPDGDAQKIDAARAAAALARLRDIVTQTSEPDTRRSQGRDRRGLVR